VPIALFRSEADAFGRWVTRYQKDSQNAPNELNASAPKVLPLVNSHIPASSWAMPP